MKFNKKRSKFISANSTNSAKSLFFNILFVGANFFDFVSTDENNDFNENTEMRAYVYSFESRAKYIFLRVTDENEDFNT